MEHHNLYHGNLNPNELNLSVIAPARKVVLDGHKSRKRPRGSDTLLYPKKQRFSCDELRQDKKGCRWCQLARFSTHERYPITISNDVDNSTLPSDFFFIERSILRSGVEAADRAFRSGCDCQEDKQCQYKNCHCLQDVEFRGGNPGPKTKIHAYYSKGPKKDCLRPEMLESRDPIYECHDGCSCSLDCSNRVVERGRKVPLEIFKTSDGRGWGVRSSVDIQEGQYVDRYVGEIITGAEAQRRREESDIAQRKDVYLFALDKFSDENSMDPRLAGPSFEVDGEFKSGPTRFINHSCDPNLRSFAKVGDHADKHIHDLALFAIRDIPAGQELTFDYVDGADTDLAIDSTDPLKKQDMTRCLCGSEDCRGFLW